MSWRQLPPAATPTDWRALWHAFSAEASATAQFAAQLATWLDVPNVHLAATGRAALHGLLSALSRQRPKRLAVVMPAYTCPVLVTVCQRLSLQPRFVDMQPSTFDFEPAQLTAAVDEQVLAILHVHPFGLPRTLDLSQQLANEHGAWLIEDCAQALGATVAGRPVGVSADFGLYSFGIGKPLSLGGGGAVSCNRVEANLFDHLPSRDGKLSRAAKLVVLSAVTEPPIWAVASRLANGIGNSEQARGYATVSLSAVQAALGQKTLPSLSALNAKRRATAQAIAKSLPERWQIAPLNDAKPAYLRLPLLLDAEAQRDHLWRTLRKQGLGAGRLYEKTLPALFEDATTAAKRYPGATAIARTLLTLPTHHFVQPKAIETMRLTLQSAA